MTSLSYACQHSRFARFFVRVSTSYQSLRVTAKVVQQLLLPVLCTALSSLSRQCRRSASGVFSASALSGTEALISVIPSGHQSHAACALVLSCSAALSVAARLHTHSRRQRHCLANFKLLKLRLHERMTELPNPARCVVDRHRLDWQCGLLEVQAVMHHNVS